MIVARTYTKEEIAKMDKGFLMEHQILHDIQKLRDKLQKAEEEYAKEELTEYHYKFLKARYNGGIDYLTIILTIFDNQLSNFTNVKSK